VPGGRDIVHELAIAARLAGRSLRRRLAQGSPAVTTDAGFRAELEPWLEALPAGLVAGHSFLRLPPGNPPWHDSGLELAPGDQATVLAAGRVYLSRALDVWVGPALRLWCRLGDGPVFRGTRPTNTFTAERGGRLMLGSRFPGEWLDPAGNRCAEGREFAGARGELSVLVLRWARGVDVDWLFRGFEAQLGAPELVRAEARRLTQAVPAPERWSHDWRIGPSEIFQTASAADGRPALHCRTHADVGILQRDARWPLAPGTRLKWSWCVHALPSDLAEDTVPSHDYLSIAVEFDDGQDITYFWSAALPPETVFRCPLPVWKDIETHVVVRSGPAGLGRWLDEERELYADYRRILGGPAREVLRIWLIGESVMQRGHGRCEYASIRLTSNERTLEVL
jgi:hypothetical protein